MRKIPLITLLLALHGILFAQEHQAPQLISKGASQRVNNTWLAYRNTPESHFPQAHCINGQFTFSNYFTEIIDTAYKAVNLYINIRFENDSNSFTLEAETPPVMGPETGIPARGFTASGK